MSTIDTNPLRQSVTRDFSSPVTAFAHADRLIGAALAAARAALDELPLQEPIAV